MGTSPQAVVITLAHNHMTNLFTLSYRGAIVITFGSKGNSVYRSRQDTSPLGVVTPLPFDHVTLMSLLYLQLFKGHKG